MSKLLTVFGATGQQGGSLINYVLKNPELSKIYKLRGITRDVSKPASVALKDKGVEVVKADLNDPDSVKAAVAGTWAVFAVTNYWEQASAEIEITQGKTVADATVGAGAELLIWSSLPHITNITNGKLRNVKHFDSKAIVEAYIRGLPIKSAFYMPGHYMQTFVDMWKPKPIEEGVLELALSWSGKDALPLIDITDTGIYVAPILLEPEKYNGKNFTAATAFYPTQEIVDIFSKVTGRKLVFRQVSSPKEMHLDMPPDMADALSDMHGLITTYGMFGPTGKDDLAWTHAQLKDSLTTWDEFVKRKNPWTDVV